MSHSRAQLSTKFVYLPLSKRLHFASFCLLVWLVVRIAQNIMYSLNIHAIWNGWDLGEKHYRTGIVVPIWMQIQQFALIFFNIAKVFCNFAVELSTENPAITEYVLQFGKSQCGIDLYSWVPFSLPVRSFLILINAYSGMACTCFITRMRI